MENNILDNVLKLANTAEWNSLFDSVFAEHVTPALEEFGLDLEELQELLGEQAPVMLLLAYEDFQSREFGPERRNLITEFLQRNEESVSAEDRAWLEALRDSVLSLYKVIGVTPGESFTVRDELMGGEPVEVLADSISEELYRDDIIVMRVVQLGSEVYPSEGVLSFDAELAKVLREELAVATGVPASFGSIPYEALRAAAPLFTKTWLSLVVPELSMEPPLINTDGELIAGNIARFALGSGITEARIAEALGAVPELQSTSVNSWDWIAAPEFVALDEATVVDENLESAPKYLGDLELEGRDLVLATNSAERAYRGLGMIRHVLGKLVGDPVIETFAALEDELD